MVGAISLQEDIMGMEDRGENSAILDTLSLKNSQEERSTRQLGVQEMGQGGARDGNTVIVGIRWYLQLWKSRKECEDDVCESTLYKTQCCFYNYHFQ